MIHVPSLAAMESDEEVFSQKAFTFFCPFAVSPQVMNVKEHTNEMVGQLDDKARSFWRWRAKSSSVVMVITHGKLAFLFQKNEMVEQLDNKSDPLLPHPEGSLLRMR